MEILACCNNSARILAASFPVVRLDSRYFFTISLARDCHV